MALAQMEKRYTADEFEALADSQANAERLLELVDGEIVEKMPTQEHGTVGSLINYYLCAWALPRKAGRVSMEVRYRRPEDHYNSRIPDVSFSSARTPMVTRGSTPTFPDLAVEIKSPNDSLMKLRAKARFFLANGTKMVWLVIPELRLVEVYTLEEEYILGENDTLDGGDVLPGFTLAVKDIFADPLGEEQSE